MRYYETMYIVHAALEAGRLKDLIELVNGLLKDKDCEVLYNELWGKKKLAYFIDKQKYGTYILVQYKSDGSSNNSFNMELEHNPNVLAYLTTQINENNILDQESDINKQIDGNEKEKNIVAKDKEEDNSSKDDENQNQEEISSETEEPTSSDATDDENQNQEEISSETEESDDNKNTDIDKEKVEE